MLLELPHSTALMFQAQPRHAQLWGIITFDSQLGSLHSLKSWMRLVTNFLNMCSNVAHANCYPDQGTTALRRPNYSRCLVFIHLLYSLERLKSSLPKSLLFIMVSQAHLRGKDVKSTSLYKFLFFLAYKAKIYKTFIFNEPSTKNQQKFVSMHNLG